MTITEILVPEEKLIDTNKPTIGKKKWKKFDTVEEAIEFNDQMRTITKLVLKQCCDSSLTRKINARLNRLKVKSRLNDTLAHFDIMSIVLHKYKELSSVTLGQINNVLLAFQEHILTDTI